MSKRQKTTARKTTKGSSSRGTPSRGPTYPFLDFTEEAYIQAYERHKNKPIVEGRFLDWGVLREFGLEEEIRELISVGAWETFFEIREPTYRELTLEFLSTFYLERYFGTVDSPDTVQFRLGGITYSMSVTQLSVRLGLYSMDFVTTPEYKDMLVGLPHGLQEWRVWTDIATGHTYDPAKSKASSLRKISWRVLHSIFSHTLSGRGHSHGVVSNADILFLYSMIERVPIHIGGAFAHFFSAQATDRRVGSIAAGPYITRLARRLGVFDRPYGSLTIVSHMAPLRRGILIAMGIHPVEPQQTQAEQQ